MALVTIILSLQCVRRWVLYLKRLQALESLSVSLPNVVDGDGIFCNQGMKILAKIKSDLPKMELLKFIDIAFPSFQCEVDEQDSDDHPDFWSKLQEFMFRCASIQRFSFEGDPVPHTLELELWTLCSTKFVTRYPNMPRSCRRNPPPSVYFEIRNCRSLFDKDEDPDPDDKSGSNDLWEWRWVDWSLRRFEGPRLLIRMK